LLASSGVSVALLRTGVISARISFACAGVMSFNLVMPENSRINWNTGGRRMPAPRGCPAWAAGLGGIPFVGAAATRCAGCFVGAFAAGVGATATGAEGTAATSCCGKRTMGAAGAGTVDACRMVCMSIYPPKTTTRSAISKILINGHRFIAYLHISTVKFITRSILQLAWTPNALHYTQHTG
jgi:hypothetical protein